MAYDPTHDTLYAIAENPASRVLVVDRATGATTVVHTLGFGYASALAYDPDRDLLLSATWDGSTSRLVEIDPQTGATAVVGGSYSYNFSGLAAVPEPGCLGLLSLVGPCLLYRRRRT